MPEAFVGIGSNADPERGLAAAVAALERRFGAVRCSSVYRSAAVGGAGNHYLNMVAAFGTAEPIEALRTELRAIEERAGRRRDDARVCALDLDLLLYGERVDAAARVPRPQILTLPFVLGPLAEIAAQLRHPVTGERYGAVWLRGAGGMPLERLGPLR